MRAAKKRDATVNKDRAYAVHGILQKLKVEVSDVKYEESEMKIYHSFCTDLLRRSGVSISLLLDAEGTETREVPSWIPDWRTGHERSWLQERIDISRRQESSGISPELAEAFHVECGRRFPSHQSLFPRFPSCPLESWVRVTNFWKPGLGIVLKVTSTSAYQFLISARQLICHTLPDKSRYHVYICPQVFHLKGQLLLSINVHSNTLSEVAFASGPSTALEIDSELQNSWPEILISDDFTETYYQYAAGYSRQLATW